MTDDHEDHDDEDENHCFHCGQLHDMCVCHEIGDCGRRRSGGLSDSCAWLSTGECHVECPHSR